MNLENIIIKRILSLGGSVEDKELFQFEALKAKRQFLDFCNITSIPDEAMVYLIDWTVANYMTEQCGYSKEWEKMRENAERGAVKYRKLRW